MIKYRIRSSLDKLPVICIPCPSKDTLTDWEALWTSAVDNSDLTATLTIETFTPFLLKHARKESLLTFIFSCFHYTILSLGCNKINNSKTKLQFARYFLIRFCTSKKPLQNLIAWGKIVKEEIKSNIVLLFSRILMFTGFYQFRLLWLLYKTKKINAVEKWHPELFPATLQFFFIIGIFLHRRPLVYQTSFTLYCRSIITRGRTTWYGFYEVKGNRHKQLILFHSIAERLLARASTAGSIQLFQGLTIRLERCEIRCGCKLVLLSMAGALQLLPGTRLKIMRY